jgi:hypothetical protein
MGWDAIGMGMPHLIFQEERDGGRMGNYNIMHDSFKASKVFLPLI